MSKRVFLKPPQGRRLRKFIIDEPYPEIGQAVYIPGDPNPYTVAKLEDTEIIARFLRTPEGLQIQKP